MDEKHDEFKYVKEYLLEHQAGNVNNNNKQQTLFLDHNDVSMIFGMNITMYYGETFLDIFTLNVPAESKM